LRKLMERMGHTSTRAALIYQHATRERDEAIAAAMGEVLASVRRKGTARKPIGHVPGTTEGNGFLPTACVLPGLSWGFGLERAKGIEPS
jgi:hypothetical protein